MKATIEISRTPKANCPACQHELGATTGASIGKAGEPQPPPPRPQPGSLTLCFYCGTLLKFDDGLIPRAISEEERQRILDEIPLVREVVDRWKKQRGA